MAKLTPRKRLCSCPNDGISFLGGSLFTLLLTWTLCFTRNELTLLLRPIFTDTNNATNSETILDPPQRTFYDDPELSYSIEKPLKNWDEKRKEWLQFHPSFAAGAQDRILIVTGSQPSPCKSSIGDHLLLRCFKNKVDYCRIHGYDIFYNNLYLHPKMDSYWAKIPIVRAAMIAHPEVEWIWWMDADAVFTDMEFKIPLGRYENYNLVVHGWPNMVYGDKENKSWTGLNAGSYLIRNCQWSMELMNVWSRMGPWTGNYEKWGRVLMSIFKDKLFPLPDDQSSLIYLLFRNREKWGEKTYIEGEYGLEYYWMAVLGRFENISAGYREIEEEARGLRRRHAEKLSGWYGALREPYLKERGYEPLSRGRRPFVTHFTGCQPCSGEHNPSYDGNTCWKEMERALNFANNQVLRNYGFAHKDLLNSSVSELPFDYPWPQSVTRGE